MNRLPIWLQLTVGVLVLAFAFMGVTNSVHLAAKIVYAVLIAGSAVALTIAAQRQRRSKQ